MKKSIMIFLSSVCFLAACQQAPKTNSNPTAEKIKTKEDTLYQAVMDLHNETMAKYGQLLGYQKKAQRNVDSIKQYLQKNNCYCEGVHDAFAKDSILLNQLKAADKSMNDWMAQFNPDPKMKTTDERAAYFQDQKEKATIMKTGFFEALDKAEKAIGTQTHKSRQIETNKIK